MAYFFKNLVFEGGGVKGIAYVGALEVLEEEKILQRVRRVAGTSAGAILAVLVGVGYTPAEIKKVLWELDFNNFLDDSWGFIQDTQRLVNQFGWYKGDFFRKWIGELIRRKTGNSETTFADLAEMKSDRQPIEIFLIGTNLSTGFSEIFSNEHTPRYCIADAARISMSIPLFFAAKRNFREDVYVDGGVLDNYPVKIFDRKKYVRHNLTRTDYYDVVNASLERMPRRISEYVYNKETLGFRLDALKHINSFRDNAEPPHTAIHNFFDYTAALLRTLIGAGDNTHLHSDDWQRTIYIDTLGIGATDFGISDDKKRALLESGRDYARKYFEWYNNGEPKANK